MCSKGLLSKASMDSSSAPAFTIFNPCIEHSSEDFQHQLICASMELQKVKAEGRLQESKLWRLQELLSIMTRERDEAREECRRLQECLLLQSAPAMGVDSPSSFMHSSSMVSSPSSSPWSLQELEEHLNSDDFGPSILVPAPFELQQALESFSQSCDDGQDMQLLFPDVKPGIENAHMESHQQFHLQILDEALPFVAPPCFNVSEPQKDETARPVATSVRALSRQSSANSTSGSLQCIQKGQCSMEFSDDTTVLGPAFAPAKNAPLSTSSTDSNLMYVGNQALPSALLVNSNGAYMTDDAPALMSSISNNGSHVTDNASPLTSHLGNNEAPLAIKVRPPMPSMGNSGSSTAGACPMPSSMGNYLAPLAHTSLPVMPTMANTAASTVYATSSVTSTVKNAATPTSSVVNDGASQITASNINTQSSKVSMDADMVASPAEDLSSVVMSTPKAARSIVAQAVNACPPNAPRCDRQGIPAPLRQVHLPEPPEADPQVMLNSLPEKGKLLQAVMQAGPLLQTLLLAGPLPQWRHPPPALSTGDIPKVSLAASNVLLPYQSHMPSSAVQGPIGSFSTNTKGPISTTTRRRPANAEPCSRSKKLRKLSRSPTTQGRAMHMVAGRDEQRLAAGALTQLAAN